MPPPENQGRIQFDGFELNLQTRELRKDGRLIKLQDQPGRLLALLACRAGELVTRAEIEKALWQEGEFVEFEHAVNTAIRKVREALGDDLDKPRFIETLPRKGYRFIATVQAGVTTGGQVDQSNPASSTSPTTAPSFSLPLPLARSLFLTVQAGYLAMYCAALYKSEALDGALEFLLGGRATALVALVLVAAMCGIAVRLYLVSAVGLHHPAAGEKFRRLFPVLFVLDTFWALSPLLLVRRLGLGLALGAIAGLAYLPFSQRTLIRSIYRLS